MVLLFRRSLPWRTSRGSESSWAPPFWQTAGRHRTPAFAVPTPSCFAPQVETSAPIAFTFDSEPVRLPAEPRDGGVRLFDLDAGVVFDVESDAREVTVRYAGSRLSARVRFMRVIREYFHNHALHSGRLLLHAAAVVYKRRALGIAGGKGAGKTTAMLRLLDATTRRFCQTIACWWT